MPVSTALEVVAQVARALAAAAEQGLVHRDLKPANLMLVDVPELTVKVIDFGLAKAAVDATGEAGLTHGGFVVRTRRKLRRRSIKPSVRPSSRSPFRC